MIGDLMLRWMSEIGEGSARNLRERLQWLARTADLQATRADTGRWLRDVSALGHAEVDWAQDRWAVTPAAVVRLPAADGVAVLTGSRRRSTISRLSATDLAVHEVSPEPAAAGIPVPTAVFVQFDSSAALADAAQEAGAAYGGCAAERLVARLRTIGPGAPAAPPAVANETLERRTGPGPRDWELIEARASAFPDGLYSLKINGRREFRTVQSGVWLRCDMSSGVFLELARLGQSAMRWRPESGHGREHVGTLFIDWGAPLPPLHARSLTLCSGLIPRFSGSAGTVIYRNVPHLVAKAVAGSLHQALVGN